MFAQAPQDLNAPDLFVASHSPLLHNLNPEQLAAVTLPPVSALILAGAGSGKTRVLTTRIAWLLQTGQVSPGGLMAVTFTNKAAKEMLTRLTSMLPVNVRGMWIGTFHGLCNRFLRAHYKLANLPSSFQILDTQDQLSPSSACASSTTWTTNAIPPSSYSGLSAAAKRTACVPKTCRATAMRQTRPQKKIEIYQLYEEQCQREGVVDFGELMLRSYELLRDNDPVREHYQRRFKHILIDEFQDTNKLQYAWIKMLAGHGVGSQRRQCLCGRVATA
jgi:DNA helicase-2/ATP-dependent DNA helicase PcrA